MGQLVSQRWESNSTDTLPEKQPEIALTAEESDESIYGSNENEQVTATAWPRVAPGLWLFSRASACRRDFPKKVPGTEAHLCLLEDSPVSGSLVHTAKLERIEKGADNHLLKNRPVLRAPMARNDARSGNLLGALFPFQLRQTGILNGRNFFAEFGLRQTLVCELPQRGLFVL